MGWLSRQKNSEEVSIATKLRSTQLLLDKKQALLQRKEEAIVEREQKLEQREAALQNVKGNLEVMLKNTKKAHKENLPGKRDKIKREIAALRVASREEAKKLKELQKSAKQAKLQIQEAEDVGAQITLAKETLAGLQKEILQRKKEGSKKWTLFKSSDTKAIEKKALELKKREERVKKLLERVQSKQVTLAEQAEEVDASAAKFKDLERSYKQLDKKHIKLVEQAMQKEKLINQLDAEIKGRQKELKSLSGEFKQITELMKNRNTIRNEIQELQEKTEFKRKSVLKLVMMKQAELDALKRSIDETEKRRKLAVEDAKSHLERQDKLNQERRGVEEDIRLKKQELELVKKDLLQHIEKFKETQDIIANNQKTIEKQKLAIKSKESLLITKESILKKKEAGLLDLEKSLQQRNKTLEEREALLTKKEVDAVKISHLLKSLAESLEKDKNHLAEEAQKNRAVLQATKKEMDQHSAQIKETLEAVEGARLSLSVLVKEDISALKEKEDELVGYITKIDNDKKVLSRKHKMIIDRVGELRAVEKSHGSIKKNLKERERSVEKREKALKRAEERLTKNISKLEAAKKDLAAKKAKIKRVRELRENIAQLEADHSELKMQLNRAKNMKWATPVVQEPVQRRPATSVDQFQSTLSQIKTHLHEHRTSRAKALLHELEQALNRTPQTAVTRPILYEIMDIKTAIKLAELG